MKRIITSVAVIVALVGATLVLAPAPNASAINLFGGCNGNETTAVCGARNDDAAHMIRTVVDTMLLILGTIAVIMIIVGGIRYTTSRGDASDVKAAKDTIMYSVVGLVVAIMSFAIVNFVISRF